MERPEGRNVFKCSRAIRSNCSNDVKALNEEVYQVRVVLEGEMARRFSKIKEKYGLEANTDVIRLLITMECDRIERLEAGHPTLRTYVPIE